MQTSRPSSAVGSEKARSKGAREQHRQSKHPLYRVWLNMMDRVRNPNNPAFHNYGGRGISLSAEMTSFSGFLSVIAEIGDRPSPAHQLDRKDNDGNYCRGNLRWATKREQARNMRKNHLLTVGDETLPLAVWAERANLAPSTIHYRLGQGMSVEQAVSLPARFNGREA